jgi:putative transposase
MAESFFASLECELLDRRVFRSQAEARMEVFRYIEGWYNPRRRHSALGHLSPLRFEAEHRAQLQPALAPPAHPAHPSPAGAPELYSPAPQRSPLTPREEKGQVVIVPQLSLVY